MTAEQAITLGTSWAKRLVAICLFVVIAAMVLKVFGQLFGVPVYFRVPDWSQQNALMIAALSYALR